MVDSRTSEEPRTEELGRYRLVATLGQGGMGTIHLAVAGGLGAFRKLLVLKELRRDLTRNERFVQMFLAEAKLAARLNHPNVVQTLEAGREGDRFFLSMEFLDGQPLSQILKSAERAPRFSLAARIQVLCHALAGLHYAHELCDYDGTALQIVHRDVSPQNVFVTYDGQVKVVDFGIAKAAGEDSLTSPGIFKGKLAYASPEQVRGQPVDRRSDIFSVGVMLWEAVAMRRLAPGSPTRAMIEARIGGTEPRLFEAVPDVEPVLAEICDKAMHADPSMRYATAEEFRAALQTFLFVTGENVDGAALGQAVRTKFADDRAAMHRLIDVYIRESGKDEPTESMVRALRLQRGEESNHDDPTTVADLSQLIESSKSDPPPTLPPPGMVAPGMAPPGALPRVAPSPVRWVVAGAAVLAVAAVLVTQGRLTNPAESPRTASAPTASAAPVDVPAESKASPEPLPEPNAPPVQRSPRAADVGRGATRTQPTAEAAAHPDPVEPASAPQKPHGATPAAETAAPVAAETTKEAAPQGENMGDDLRQLKRRSPRTLDTQDPFQ